MGHVDTMCHSCDSDYDTMKAKIDAIHLCYVIEWVNDLNNKKINETRLLQLLVSDLKDQLLETYNQARNYADPKTRLRWRTAIRKEIRGLAEILKVGKLILLHNIPKGRRCVNSKWVFDIKGSGLFKVCLVACGYSQIPGVNFTESYAPEADAFH